MDAFFITINKYIYTLLVSFVNNFVIKFFKNWFSEAINFAYSGIGGLIDKYNIFLKSGSFFPRLRGCVSTYKFAIFVNQFNVLVDLNGFIVDWKLFFNKRTHCLEIIRLELLDFKSCQKKSSIYQNFQHTWFD